MIIQFTGPLNRIAGPQIAISMIQNGIGTIRIAIAALQNRIAGPQIARAIRIIEYSDSRIKISGPKIEIPVMKIDFSGWKIKISAMAIENPAPI